MLGYDGLPPLPVLLRTAVGLILVAFGLWFVSDMGPKFSNTLVKHAGWFAVAGGIWLIPFVRRHKRS
jgi:hypothetical protein